jgi:hypothetical protein
LFCVFCFFMHKFVIFLDPLIFLRNIHIRNLKNDFSRTECRTRSTQRQYVSRFLSTTTSSVRVSVRRPSSPSFRSYLCHGIPDQTFHRKDVRIHQNETALIVIFQFFHTVDVQRQRRK